MKKYNDLEISILSCLLLKPSLMKEVKLEEKHFKKHKRVFKFMKAFYKKFGNFDISLMYSVTKNKVQLLMYIEMLLNLEPIPEHFKYYQKQLLELYSKSEKEIWIGEKIYDIATDLYVGNISLEEFENKLNKIYDISEKMYK